MSSSRNRPPGRVGFRVRDKYVTPLAYLGVEFGKDTFINSTINWFVKLESMTHEIEPINPNFDLTKSGNQVITFKKPTQIPIGKPPLRRRQVRKRMIKPKYIMSPYGTTPFGRHALDRGDITVIESYSTKERAEMMNYMAISELNKISEHVTYGSVTAYSFEKNIGMTIVSTDIRNRLLPDDREKVLFGKYDDYSISILKNIACRFPDDPVLSLHRYQGGTFYFHGLYNGEPTSMDFAGNYDDMIVGTYMEFEHRTGRKMYCVNQGTQTTPHMGSVGVTNSDVQQFVNAESITNDYIAKKAIDNVNESFTEIATFSFVVGEKNEERLAYIEMPRMPHSVQQRPSNRAKMICDYALGDYWSCGIEGVALKSYMKGHWSGNNIWTGGTLGYKMYSSALPEYRYSPVGDNVSHCIVCGGIGSENQLSNIQLERGARLNVVASTSGNTSVFGVIKLPNDEEVRKSIYVLNTFRRWHLDVDSEHGFCIIPMPFVNLNCDGITRAQARATLEQAIMGGVGDTSY